MPKSVIQIRAEEMRRRVHEQALRKKNKFNTGKNVFPLLDVVGENNNSVM